MKILKAFGQQLAMFNQPSQNREGEIKQGKSGQLVLRKDQTGKGAHWRLANKDENKNAPNGKTIEPVDNNLTTQDNNSSKIINTKKAYDLLSGQLGNKSFVTNKTGGLLGEGIFQLINENQDGTISLFMKDDSGESKVINVPTNQAIITKNNNVEFQFADKNIGISLTEKAEDDEPADQPEPDEDKVISDAKKQRAWDHLANQYIDRAQSQKDRYLQDLDEISSENELEPMSHKYRGHAIKSKESILNKFERNEAAGKPYKNEQLTDALRGTIVIKNPTQFDNIISSLKKRGYEVWNDDITNLYEDKNAGYKHIAIKVTRGHGDNLVKELLLMTPAMHEAKYGFGHDIYDLNKNISIALGNKIPKGHRLYPHLEDFKKNISQIANWFYARAYYADLKGEPLSAALDSISGTASKEPPSTQVSKNKRVLSSPKFSIPPKRAIRSLRESLKAVWQPLSASLSQSSGDMFSLGDSSSAIDFTMTSIVNPTKNIINKYAGKVNNLMKSYKLKINISKHQ